MQKDKILKDTVSGDIISDDTVSKDDGIKEEDKTYIWNTDFHGIGLWCCEKLVRVKNDENLITFLNEEGIGSMELAKVMKEFYFRQIGRELNISEKSLAIEILGHVYFGEFTEKLKHIPFVKNEDSKYIQFVESFRVRMDVIDCGERDIDSNRFVWDDLVPFSKLIFTISGKKA